MKKKKGDSLDIHTIDECLRYLNHWITLMKKKIKRQSTWNTILLIKDYSSCIKTRYECHP